MNYTMSIASILSKEKIVSLSEIQKNPGKALQGDIIRIVKNGQEIGIYMSKEQFEDFVEEMLPLKKEFKEELDARLGKMKPSDLKPLKDL